MKNMARKFFSNTEGTTAVEFALIATAFLTLIFGIFEGGRLLLTMNAFQSCIEDATRYALVHEDATAEDLTDYIDEDLSSLMIDTANMTLDMDFEDSSGITFLDITGTYDYVPLLTLFLPSSWTTITLHAESRFPFGDSSDDT